MNMKLPINKRELLFQLWHISLKQAMQEQGLTTLVRELEQIVPDIANQFHSLHLESDYLTTKVRAQQAFQISLVNRVIGEFSNPTVCDIGDSSGTLIKYILGLHGHSKRIRCLSVNLDPEAIVLIRSRGLEAIHARAEDLDKYNISTDVFLCFETVDHLLNPLYFFHELSSKTKASYFVVTTPYVAQSRMGLHHMRAGRNREREDVFAHNTHIFELSPPDWKLMVTFCGWKVVYEQIYLQYPKKNIMRITKSLWKRFDFEGFYGMILKRDDTWSSRYKDWPA